MVPILPEMPAPVFLQGAVSLLTALRACELFHSGRRCDMSKITIRATVDKTMVGTAMSSAGQPAAEEQLIIEEGHVEERAKIRPVSRVKAVRRSLGLTQEEFAARYGIPLGTLRDWEQGRTEPDQPARAYIRVIACNPEWVSRALAGEPP